jgi:diguanylate cyclase (GGDEF)-like protein
MGNMQENQPVDTDVPRPPGRGVSGLRALSEIGRAGVGASAGDVTRRVVTAAMAALEADAVALSVWEADATMLRTILNVGDLASWEIEEPVDELYPADRATLLTSLDRGELGHVACLADEDLLDEDREYLISLNKFSQLNVPLLVAGEWWGELYATRREGREPFSRSDLDWASAVAAQVSAALESAEHVSRVERLAQTDSMTGLANRRALDEWLDAAIVRWRDEQVPMGLAVVDLNGLKRINDDQGHDAGDRVLRQLAMILEKAGKGFDEWLAARLGGDEFCLAVSGHDAPRLVDAAAEICRQGWDLLPHGLACGAVVTTDTVGSIEIPARLLRLADAAQYRAKRIRSRVPVVAGRPLPADQAIALTGADPDEPGVRDRRMFRGRDESSLGHLSDAVLRGLDQAADESVRFRLGLVADLVTHHLDGVGWWLSLRAGAGGAVRTVDFSLYRRPWALEADELKDELTEVFDVEAYPQTGLALAGGSYAVTVDDTTADQAEVAILDGLGAHAVVAAGGTDEHGDGWLVEVFLDDLSTQGQEMAGMLRLLVLAALHPVRDR